MSIIINSLQERQNIDTTGSIVSAVSFSKKWLNSFHEGHVELVQHAKSVSDIVFCHFFPIYPTADFLYGDETAFYRDSTFIDVPNQQYMIDWCELQGVDYIWFATEDYHIDWFSEYNINDLKTWADDLCANEGYTHPDVDIMRNIKRLLITLKPLVDNQYYHYDYRVSSWKDGTIRFIEKHFYEKYLGTNVVIIDPALAFNELPLSSGINVYFSTKDVEKIIQVQDAIVKVSNATIIGNPEKFETDMRDFTDSLSDNDVIIRLEEIHIPNISNFLPLNKLLLEVTTNIAYKGRYIWSILK